MKKLFYQAMMTTLACLLVITAGTAHAFPSKGGNCTACHSAPAGNMNIAPDPIDIVIDDNGVGLQRWGMKPKSSAIIVLDAEGKVLYAKDGPLSEIEVEHTIGLIESQAGCASPT